MGDLWDLWFLLIPATLVAFIVFLILNSIFNIKVTTHRRPIHRAPAGSSDSTDSSFSASNTDTSTHPGYDSSPHSSSSDSGSGASDSGSSSGSDSGSSGGGDGGGGGGGD
ncbi:putative membrane protein YgcG [Devosia sp. UYZn731]|uniref:hypothetical protein n=1 Tax=Devosia sp. UYZn731 TaxID=3156345 RepID=UPI0033947DC4